MSLRSLIESKSRTALQNKSAFYLIAQDRSMFVRDCGVDFQFQFYDMKLLNFFSKKSKNNTNKRDPLLPPFCSDLHVCDIGDHHVLINKFMQRICHVVLSSKDKDAKQGDDLFGSDFVILGKMLEEYEGKGIAYYNAGINSGASQKHKHLQFMPNIEGNVLNAMGDNANLPFVYHALKLRNMKPKEIKDAYKELCLMGSFDKQHNSYNFMISNNIAAYVPRTRSLSKNHVLINSISMSGILSIWEWNPPKNPMSLLSDVTIPKII